MDRSEYELAQTFAQKMFVEEPSMTIVEDELISISVGRVYVWDTACRCFRLKLGLPQSDGTVAIVTIPEEIKTPLDIIKATTSADRFFRERAMFPTAMKYGFDAEDQLVRIIKRLGFTDGLQPHD